MLRDIEEPLYLCVSASKIKNDNSESFPGSGLYEFSSSKFGSSMNNAYFCAVKHQNGKSYVRKSEPDDECL